MTRKLLEVAAIGAGTMLVACGGGETGGARPVRSVADVVRPVHDTTVEAQAAADVEAQPAAEAPAAIQPASVPVAVPGPESPTPEELTCRMGNTKGPQYDKACLERVRARAGAGSS
jgi:hypothetical protein